MIKNFFGHLKTVITHKKYVAKYCFMCGLYYQGIVHDLSKFSPVEFFESVKYYTGTRSPIDVCKEHKGYSNAWFHHRGRNKHHWEMWLDNFEKGTTYTKIPFKYVLEMVCDFLGAGNAYMGENFTFKAEYEWWQNKRKVVKMHEDTLWLLDTIFDTMLKNGMYETLTNKKLLKKLKMTYQCGLNAN